MMIYRIALILTMLVVALPAIGQDLKPMPGQELQAVVGDELQTLTEECNSCHGPNGVSGHDDVPSLAGLPAGKLVEAVEQFYFYERHCPSIKPRYGEKDSGSMNMCDVSGRMNKQQVLALGEYYEKQKAGTPKPAPAVEPKEAETH